MSQRRMEHAALAIADNHKDWFVLGPAAFAGLSFGRGEHGQVFRWTPELGIEFVHRVPPSGGQAFHDRMLRFACLHQEFVCRAMGATGSRRSVEHDLAITPAHHWAGFFVASTPAAESDNIAVFAPARKRAACGLSTRDR